ncbi:M23 family metallopeptidase [Plantactinospora soyae]|uniref:Murein DD-endopeptidase MepM/ murein hydrolase activator NlpD n=1 Tax=Plantactinospora soyae TaxID=1544732 RepID=A0A927QX70_9ACTN|nr:M23 family metallopeptidase [Plantactinospora soyae]MBE1486377.1 murein DD-endopeptidase MepM/ murein hydrolase activator NlpD [Plantactinospora soyae]
MSWRGTPERGRRSGRRTYPVVVLLATALVAGCAETREPPGPPAFEPMDTSVPSTGGTSPLAAATPTIPATSGTSPSPKPTTPSPTTGSPRYVFPVTGNASYHPTHSGYPATDIFANCGAPVLAVTAGRILEVSRVDNYSKSGPQGPNNGGRAVSLLGDDGVRYYGSHLTNVAAGINAGVRVRAGQQLGTVGKTGNANNVCHLHFGISPPCKKTADWWIRRGVVWPAPFLDGWRKKRNTSPVAKVRDWHADRGCPKAP